MCSQEPTLWNGRRTNLAFATAAGAGLLALAGWYAKPSPPASADKLIDRFLPGAEFFGEVSVLIHASPDEIFRVVNEVTLAEMPLATLVGELRYLPARLTGHPMPKSPAHVPFLKLVLSGSGNIVLGTVPGRELLLGSIGMFHDPADQRFVKLRSPEEFVAFGTPAYQKLAMSFRVTGNHAAEGYRLTLEHRTHALSPAARAKFALYWLGIKPGGNLVSWLMLVAIKRRAESVKRSPETNVGVDAYSE